ncbi:hypothetical protein ACSZM7_20365, partial [Aeromonas veronii]
NLKAFPDGKAFLLCAILPSDPHICTQEPTQSPASRPGFDVFSVLNSQRLVFTCQVRVPDSRLSPLVYSYIRALSASFTAI